MTSADELFRSYAAAFEANEDPSRAQYEEQLEGPERFALELMIDDYLTTSAPSRPVNRELFEANRMSAWGRKVAEVMAEPSPADLRLAREEQGISVPELAEKVLAAGGVEEPTSEEKSKAADYLGRLEEGELGRLPRRAWDSLRGALGLSIPFPDLGTSYSMALRKAPQSPGTLGMEPPESFEQAEAILYAYSIPSPKEWDRVDEFFLAED